MKHLELNLTTAQTEELKAVLRSGQIFHTGRKQPHRTQRKRQRALFKAEQVEIYEDSVTERNGRDYLSQ